MAEAAGLVVGVVALAGTFKDCIDLFGYITASRNLGHDYDLLTTKLDVQRLLLLQWADRVRLLHSDYDRRLDDTSTFDVISRILTNIQRLLINGEILRERYGIQQTGDLSKASATSRINDHKAIGEELAISQPRMARLLTDFEALCIRKKIVRKDVPLLHSVRWAIQDKDKFEALLQTLSEFISALNELIPVAGNALETTMKEDLQSLSFSRLRLVTEVSRGFKTLLGTAADRLLREICSTKILNCFWYRAMDDRRFSIDAAHEETLSWALEQQHDSTEHKCDDLYHWLKHDSGIYWISGKAGSGKSTLMKYLYEHRKTNDLLSCWAGSNSLTMVNFFFFALGSPEQKTQSGLERALLYQILNAEPTLIPELLPQMWREALSSENTELGTPSAAELKTAIAAVGQGLKSNRRFCFFIDGLDEYDGDCFKGISTIADLARNPSIKIIVASRPIPSCVQSFRRCPTLRLQDLTKRDITNYVNDIIGSHPCMKRSVALRPIAAEEICRDIASKASGVFLWVVLACRSLISGSAAGDTMEELRARLDELPPELEDLFQHMLQKIEPRYQTRAAKTLRICYEHHRFGGGGHLPAIGLAIVEDGNYDLLHCSPLAPLPETKHSKCEALEARLRSRCCGLLELDTSPRYSDDCFCGTEASGAHDDLVDSIVVFIHRTVFEFLSQPNIWDTRCLQIQDKSFETNTILSFVYLQLLQHYIDRSPQFAPLQLEYFFWQFLLYARRSDDSEMVDGIIHVMLWLGEFAQKTRRLDSFIIPNQTSLHKYLTVAIDLDTSLPHLAILLASELGMVNSLPALFNKAKLSSDIPGSLILYHAIQRPFTDDLTILSDIPTKISQTVHHLLSLGCDPNQLPQHKFRYRGLHERATSWQTWVHVLTNRLLFENDAIDTTLAFIDAGADMEDLDAFPALHKCLLDIIDRHKMSPEERRRRKDVVREIVRKIQARLSEKGSRLLDPALQLETCQDRQTQATRPKRGMSPNDEKPAKRARFTAPR